MGRSLNFATRSISDMFFPSAEVVNAVSGKLQKKKMLKGQKWLAYSLDAPQSEVK